MSRFSFSSTLINTEPFGKTTNQVIRLLKALERSPFAFVEVEEILLREYKVVPARFRPMDRMIGHTGYLIFARALDLGSVEEEE